MCVIYNLEIKTDVKETEVTQKSNVTITKQNKVEMENRFKKPNCPDNSNVHRKPVIKVCKIKNVAKFIKYVLSF